MQVGQAATFTSTTQTNPASQGFQPGTLWSQASHININKAERAQTFDSWFERIKNAAMTDDSAQ